MLLSGQKLQVSLAYISFHIFPTGEAKKKNPENKMMAVRCSRESGELL